MTVLPPLAGRGTTTVSRHVPIGLRLAADLDDLEWVGVDVEHMVVVLVGVADRPFLHRAQLHALVDARGVEDLAVHSEGEFLPVARGIVLRRGGPEDQRAPAGDLAVADRIERRLGQCGRELHRQRLAGDDHARQRSGGRRHGPDRTAWR